MSQASAPQRARPAGAIPAGWRLQRHELLPSTSDTLISLARAGEAAGLALLARQQSGGRGREGRAWVSPPGNLYLSALLRPPGHARQAPQWALLAGVATAEALAPQMRDPAALALKWPNDLLFGGAKLAGMLVEAASLPDGGLDWLVIGIGVNLAEAPALPDGRATTSLRAAGAELSPDAFAPMLLSALDRWERIWRREGFAAIRAAWLARGPAPGTELRLRQPAGAPALAGRFAGLAEDGSLLIDTGDRIRPVSAGELAGG